MPFKYVNKAVTLAIKNRFIGFVEELAMISK